VRTTEEVSPDLFEGRARRASVRAVLLTVVSRIVLALLALVALFVIARWIDLGSGGGSSQAAIESGPMDDAAVPSSAVARPVLTTADVLGRLSAALEGQGVRLVELRFGRAIDARVDVRLRIDSATDSSSQVARVLESLAAAGLEGATVRSVTPTPASVRLDVDGSILLSTERLHAERQVGGPRAVALTATVERSGALLRRLEVPESRDGTIVSLAVHGPVDALVRLLDDLERHHTAPVRFEAFRAEASSDGAYELSVAFRHRPETPDVAGTEP